jgi:hypothetical protein
MTNKEGVAADAERGPCPCPQGLALTDGYAARGNARIRLCCLMCRGVVDAVTVFPLRC